MAPRAPSSSGELYRCKTLFLDDFPIYFVIQMGPGPTHPLPNYFCYGEFGDIKIKLRVEVTAIAAADNLGQRGQSIILR